ncbi:MAG TPA: adenylate/guanylate cyclase domain-containing protein, partial [Promineifilum sp.]|nr:adenylate/guanylate cyclase domain-containing protein [Promineifilum sp.]
MLTQYVVAPLARLAAAVERRLALPGDDETLRRRRVVAFFAGLAGVNTAAVFAVLYWAGGAPLLAWLYILTVAVSGATLAYLLLRPRAYTWCVLITTTYVTIHPWIVGLASGGFRSGLLPMLWALVGPAGSLLLIGVRPALFHAGLYVVMALGSVFLDPWAAAHTPALPQNLRLALSAISALVPGMMVLFISLFLFGQVERARQQADRLLRNVLPEPIANQLKQSPATIADSHDEVTVLFADIVGFTKMSSHAAPANVVRLLNAIFSDFDELADRHGLEKIKTIGDAYMVVGGLTQPLPDHVAAVVAFAVDMLDIIGHHRGPNGEPIGLRIGIHTGPIVAGVIGRRRLIYD